MFNLKLLKIMQTPKNYDADLAKENANLLFTCGYNTHDAKILGAKIEMCRSMMHLGVVHFRFVKVNGEIRDARGTLAPRIYEQFGAQVPQGKRWTNEHTQAFYDVEKQEWRCFKKSLFLDIVDDSEHIKERTRKLN